MSAAAKRRLSAWLVREPATRFAAFRVAFGLVVLEDVVHLYLNGALGLFADAPFGLPLAIWLIVWAVVALALTLGWHTRLAALANYALAAVVLGRGSHYSQVAGDSVEIGLSLLALALPCGITLSVDAWTRGNRRAPRCFAAFRWALAAFLGIVYVDSALHKLDSPMWIRGLAVAAPMGLPSLVWTDASWISLFPPAALRLGSWGVIVFELFFPLLYAWRRTRAAAVATGICLHLGIGAIYPIPAFAGLMLAIYAGLLPERWYASLTRWEAWLGSCRRASAPSTIRRRPWLRLKSRFRWAAGAVALWLLASVAIYFPSLVPYAPQAHRLLYATTGIRSHAVFSDALFVGYVYQIRLVHRGSSFPYDPNNLLRWEVRDRLWEFWWKGTQGPWVPTSWAERRLVGWALFHWTPTDGPREVLIEARPQRVVLDRIDAAQFRKNNAAEWRRLGAITLAPGKAPELKWRERPGPQDFYLGRYMGRILNGGPAGN